MAGASFFMLRKACDNKGYYVVDADGICLLFDRKMKEMKRNTCGEIYLLKYQIFANKLKIKA